MVAIEYSIDAGWPLRHAIAAQRPARSASLVDARFCRRSRKLRRVLPLVQLPADREWTWWIWWMVSCQAAAP